MGQDFTLIVIDRSRGTDLEMDRVKVSQLNDKKCTRDEAQ